MRTYISLSETLHRERGIKILPICNLKAHDSVSKSTLVLESSSSISPYFTNTFFPFELTCHSLKFNVLMKITLGKWTIVLLLCKCNFVNFILKYWRGGTTLKNWFTKFVHLANWTYKHLVFKNVFLAT